MITYSSLKSEIAIKRIIVPVDNETPNVVHQNQEIITSEAEEPRTD